jgi:hypothetical protein
MKQLKYTNKQLERAVNKIAVNKALDTVAGRKDNIRGRLNEIVEKTNFTYPDNYTEIDIGMLQAKTLMLFLQNEFDVESELEEWYNEPSEPGEDDKTIREAVMRSVLKSLGSWYGDMRIDGELVTDLTNSIFDTLCIDKDMQDVDHVKFCDWMTDGVNLDDINFE